MGSSEGGGGSSGSLGKLRPFPSIAVPSSESTSPMRPVADRVAAWLIANRVTLAVIGLVLAGVSVERSRLLQFSRSIDAMFDRSDPALVPYRRMARTFGSNEAVLAVYDDPQLFTPAGVERLRDMAARLAALPGIASTTSLAGTPLGRRIIDIDASPTARKVVKLMEGYAVGADHRTAGIVCVLEPLDAATADSPKARAVSRADVIDRLRAEVDVLPGGTVAGEPVMLRDGFAMLTRDGSARRAAFSRAPCCSSASAACGG